MIVHRNLTVQGNTNVFYREAGQQSKPTVLLLHGFPTSSFQYRNLIPLLARNYHIIAPDLPGFGFTVTPPDYVYTFATLAETIAAFLQKLQLDHMAVYMFDYGAPIALRLATQHNVRFDAIISQNGNAYVEGFAHPFWDSTMRLWQTNSAADRDALQADAISLEAYKGQYETGVSQKAIGFIDPATYTMDWVLTERPGNKEIQLDLLYDYRKNVELYPAFQEYFRTSQVPLLAVWGENDPAFRPSGAEAYRRDLWDAQIAFLPTGHFALETHLVEITRMVLEFLHRRLRSSP